ncbi:unnamed protein product, partial [Adineta steineri]
MSDRSPNDDSAVSFDHQQSSPTVTTPTKQRANDAYENRSLRDIDPFDNHTNGQEYHSSNGTNKDEHHNGTNGNKHDEFHQYSLNNDLFPVDTNENEKASHLDYQPNHYEFSTRKNEESEDSSLNFNSNINNGLPNRNTLLLDLDPNAPHLNRAHTDTSSPQHKKNDESLDSTLYSNDNVDQHKSPSHLTSMTSPSNNLFSTTPHKAHIHSP